MSKKRPRKRNPKRRRAPTVYSIAAGEVRKLNRLLRKHGVRIGRPHKNVAEGFWKKGVFHPIRASSDYDPSRAGEKGHSRKAYIRRGARRAGKRSSS